jgi:hypothetical protein
MEKQYTTLEMINELTREGNENLKFKGTHFHGGIVIVDYREFNGSCQKRVMWNDEEKQKPFDINEFTLTIKWTKIEEDRRVNVVTAMKEHYENNRDIYVIIEGVRNDYKRVLGCQLKDQDEAPIGSKEIVYGEWYVRGNN